MEGFLVGSMDNSKMVVPTIPKPKAPKVGIRAMLDSEDEQLVRAIAVESGVCFSYALRQVIKAGLDAITK